MLFNGDREAFSVSKLLEMSYDFGISSGSSARSCIGLSKGVSAIKSAAQVVDLAMIWTNNRHRSYIP